MVLKTRLGAVLGLLIAVAASATAQQPRFSNANLQPRSAAAGLEREFRAIVSAQDAPAWIGYSVAVLGEHQMCCWNSVDSYRNSGGCCGGCRLEGANEVSFNNSDENRGVKLEGPYNMIVLFRVSGKSVEKIRTFSEDCAIDAGGLSVYWLTGVKPAESVALLASFVRGSGASTAASDDDKPSRRRADAAIAAIALHADASADAALESFINPSQSEWLRGQTAFWLGSAREHRGYDILKRMVREDPSDRVRDKVVFALSVSKVPESVDTMIAVAHDDRSSHVRGQALFWLAQKAGKKAIEAITAAIEDDPETDIKKKAVFALSQLPKDQGVPMLIQVAKTNKNPAVRKQAMFWLGQSNDPRALDFFEQVLKR
jgi:HEAT repeat protein